MRWLMIAVVVAACGGKGAAPAIGNTTVEGEHAPNLDSAEAMLTALAEAARADDGQGLDVLIHPEHGLWIWIQPGAYVVPAQLLKPGSGAPPSSRLNADVINDYWREELWNAVAGPIERGLNVMDRNPDDRSNPVYGDCGANDGAGGAERTWIVTEDLGPHHGQILEEAQVAVPAVMAQGLIHFHSWGLDVWLARDRDRWWVAHVMVWTPCDA